MVYYDYIFTLQIQNLHTKLVCPRVLKMQNQIQITRVEPADKKLGETIMMS